MSAREGRGTNPLLITAMFGPIAGVPATLALRGGSWYVVLVAAVVALVGMIALGMTCLRGECQRAGRETENRRHKPEAAIARSASQTERRPPAQRGGHPRVGADVGPRERGRRSNVPSNTPSS